jgi:hypothetical protein
MLEQGGFYNLHLTREAFICAKLKDVTKEQQYQISIL